MKHKSWLFAIALFITYVPIGRFTRADAPLQSTHSQPSQAGGSLSPDAVALEKLEFQFESAKHSAGTDTLEAVTASGSGQGRIVYTIFGFQEPYPALLALCEINRGIKQDGQQSTLHCDSLGVKKSDDRVLFDPRFSPNGRYVLFKFGSPWSSAASYQLCVLDTQTHSVKALSIHPSYFLVSWSPDSDYIAFIQGGDFQGGTNVLNYYIGPLRLFVYEWRTDKSFEVSANDTLRGPFSWIAPHTLVYGMLPLPCPRATKSKR